MLRSFLPELGAAVDAKSASKWLSQGNIGRGFSFTKKGPGRRHNNCMTDLKFRHIKDIREEFKLRIKYGRVSDAFIKRWVKHWKSMPATNESVMKRLVNKFRNVFRRKA